MTNPAGAVVSVEVLFVGSCPHHDLLVADLRALLDAIGNAYQLRERRIDTGAQARAECFLGSPTVRIDGVDVDPTATGRRDYGMACRLYPTRSGLRGAPPDDWIPAALADTQPA